jgi:hypothetical protein
MDYNLLDMTCSNIRGPTLHQETVNVQDSVLLPIQLLQNITMRQMDPVPMLV